MESANVSFSEYFLAHLPVQFSEPLIDTPMECPIILDSKRNFPAEFETTLGEPELGQPCQPTMEVFSDGEAEFDYYHTDWDSDDIDDCHPVAVGRFNEHAAPDVDSNRDRRHISILNFVSRLIHGFRDAQPNSAVTS